MQLCRCCTYTAIPSYLGNKPPACARYRTSPAADWLTSSMTSITIGVDLRRSTTATSSLQKKCKADVLIMWLSVCLSMSFIAPAWYCARCLQRYFCLTSLAIVNNLLPDWWRVRRDVTVFKSKYPKTGVSVSTRTCIIGYDPGNARNAILFF